MTVIITVVMKKEGANAVDGLSEAKECKRSRGVVSPTIIE